MRPPFLISCHAAFCLVTKTQTSNKSTTKKVDDYFRREPEQTEKKRQGELKKFRFKNHLQQTTAA